MDIIINLTSSSDAKTFFENKNEIVHQKEFSKVTQWITEKIQFVKENANHNFGREHEAISILGARGTGKTSFLLSIKEYCENNHKQEITTLKILDPTLIEEKGHVFLNIVSLIKDSIDLKLDESDCDPKSTAYQYDVPQK